MDRVQHLEMVLQSRIRPMLEDASDVIEALKVGEKIPATVLAEQIAERHNMKGPSFYPMLKLLTQDYPNIRVLRGAKGGIEKLAVAAITSPPVDSNPIAEEYHD